MGKNKSQILLYLARKAGDKLIGNKTVEKQYFHDTTVEKSNCVVNHYATLGPREVLYRL